MLERLRKAGLDFIGAISKTRATVKGWLQPRRRAAVTALLKASLLLGCLWANVWTWHVQYYSKRYPEMPLSLAWSLLTVIGGVIFAQAGCSTILKLRGARLRKLSAREQARLTSLLAGYIATGDFERELLHGAKSVPEDFEACLTGALLGTRGLALERLLELPCVSRLRDQWIARSRKGGVRQRLHAVEHLALLRDPAAIMALEVALEDPDAGVVAAAARGLLRIPSYPDREQLVRSLPGRPYLVRVLTAGEEYAKPDAADVPSQFIFRAPELHELQLRTPARAVRHRLPEVADAERSACSTLAALGASGRDLLRLMSATGLAGEAPAEALGEVLAAAAKGGR